MVSSGKSSHSFCSSSGVIQTSLNRPGKKGVIWTRPGKKGVIWTRP